MVKRPEESSRVDKTSSANLDKPKDMWQLYIDGASNHKGAGAGIVIITQDGTLLEQATTLGFLASNNEAEYEALLTWPFIGQHITAFFAKYGIKQHQSTHKYLQGNGQAEAFNKIVLDCLEKRLEGTKGKWVDELPGVLWAYRTAKRISTGETPFSLAYGTEAIIVPHITIPSISIEVGNLNQKFEQIKVNLDLLEEEIEKVIVQVVTY
ncbi:hypothetical protein L3X38_024994 [Prunus dulcis]|uniref:RNase H type-1 domain-containing protein n=1 Tax=Prunus dulcis TaxID=3755 RepID=A0AAD4W3C3_PRUDU|nr:hypothetical protein L3X38_024994 [Prunus dulcis]